MSALLSFRLTNTNQGRTVDHGNEIPIPMGHGRTEGRAGGGPAKVAACTHGGGGC
ncbi:hypothetical protein AVEN_223742-1, partial [Araneus ventricosus]